jgi:hypothetical protein
MVRIPLRRKIHRPWWATPAPAFDIEGDIKKWREKLVSSLGREPTEQEEILSWNEQCQIWKEEDRKACELEYQYYYGKWNEEKID